MAHTLIIRYHRIGDAIIPLPLIFDLANKYKEDTFSVVSDERFRPLFRMMPSNVEFIPMPYKRPSGILRGPIHIIRRELFFQKMKRLSKHFDKIAFLQFDTIEQKLYQLWEKQGKQIAISDVEEFMSVKRIENKFLDGLTMQKIHRKTFEKLGYTELRSDFDPSSLKKSDTTALFSKLKIDKQKKIVAIAPFSRERSKIYPLDKMEKVVEYFANKREDCQVLILGGGKKEQQQIATWIERYPRVISLIDRLNFSDEIVILANINVVLTMDSANLHLASLLNTPVVSVWGATAPQNGYYPEKESPDNAIVKNIDCQPCSLFGEITCKDPVHCKCLDIDPAIVIQKIEFILE